MNYDNQRSIYSHNGIRLDVGAKYGSITGLHSHDDEYQFEVLLSGESNCIFKKRSEKILPGFIDVYNPADLHEINYKNTESFIFHLHIDAAKKIYTEMGLHHQQPLFDSTQSKKLNLPLPFLCHEIAILKNIEEITELNPTIQLYKENKILTLLKLILEESDNINQYLPTVDYCSQIKVEKAKKWIQKNFSRDDITISCLAEICHLSKFHFIRVFKNVYGKTPYDYLMETRSKEAIKILKEGKYRNIEEVSLLAGFRNAAQLRYQLKKMG